MAATARLTVDLGAVAGNWKFLAEQAPRAKTGAAVKADAYGLGAAEIIPTLIGAGCRDFFVADIGEAIRARKLDGAIRIFVLSAGVTENAGALAAHRLVPVLNQRRDAEIWSAFNRQRAEPLPCALHVDTGMNRLGMTPAEAIALTRDLTIPKTLSPCLVMSHLACADEPGHPMNEAQFAAFTGVADHFPNVPRSLANSAGIFLGPDYHFDLTRPGIAIYGGAPVVGAENPMLPVATLETRILQIRYAARGETVGYGATAKLGRASRLAVVGAGYADGILRSASRSGVAVREGPNARLAPTGWLLGYQVPVIGRVSMDLMAFDVTEIPPPLLEQAGWIELFGKNASVDAFAYAAGTISYELLTRIGPRVERRVLE